MNFTRISDFTSVATVMMIDGPDCVKPLPGQNTGGITQCIGGTSDPNTNVGPVIDSDHIAIPYYFKRIQ